MSLTDETLVRDALDDAGNELAAPVLRLTETAISRGRRLRRRRRLAIAVGSLCAVAVVAVPSVVLMGDNPARDGDVANDPSVSLPDPLPISEQAGWWDMPAPEMLRRLEYVTPEGRSYTDPILTNEGENAPGEPVGVMRGYLVADVVEAGTTVGGVNVILYSPRSAYRDQWTCPGNLDLDAPFRCSEITDHVGDPVGRTLVVTTGPITVHEVVLRQDDGGVIYVAASNSADTKWGASSTPASDQVPFTVADLLDIARYRQWTTYEPH
jgi:hypothetical protein